MSNAAEIWKCPKCGTPLDVSPFGFYTEVVCPSCANRAFVHTQLANFKLEGVVGVGGMSIVLQAQDVVLNRPLAIKVLNDTYRDQPERIARFENECAMMARVRHENVVSVYSAGWARGQFYIAMELVQGRNLEAIVHECGPLPPTRALSITREVVLGLQAAHRAGMLHRDMKPGNVIISTGGKAKVLDFGLSLKNKDADTEAVIWATPYYVPPETLMRRNEDVRTDIYALGMTLRFLLTGKYELPGDQSSLSNLLKTKENLQPLALERPDFEPALCRLVDSMTAYRPADRPASYTILLEQINEVLAIQLEADDSKTPARVRQRVLRWAGGVALTLLLGAAGAALTTWLTIPRPTQARLEYDNHKGKGDLAVFNKALRSLKAGDAATAESCLASLDADSTEPAMAAMVCTLRYFTALVSDSPEVVETRRQRIGVHLQRPGDVSPAGVGLFSQLQLADAEFANEEAGDLPAEFERPELRGIVYTARARRFAEQGNEERARINIERARLEFSKAPAAYAGMADMLGVFEARLPDIIFNVGLSKVRGHLAGHEFDKADTQIAALRQIQNISPGNLAVLDALQDISRVGRGVTDLLKNRLPNLYRPGMPATEMKNIASRLNVPGLSAEVYVVGLLLSGDYAAAFDANPYKDESESARPFDILLRDWQAVLK